VPVAPRVCAPSTCPFGSAGSFEVDAPNTCPPLPPFGVGAPPSSHLRHFVPLKSRCSSLAQAGGVGALVADAKTVGVAVGVLVGVDVGVPVGVLVGVEVGVEVGVPVGVDVGLPVGVAVAALHAIDI